MLYEKEFGHPSAKLFLKDFGLLFAPIGLRLLFWTASRLDAFNL